MAKLVYYGPGLCGKTRNLEYINEKVAGKTELVSLATEGDRTIFFDFMPLDLGKVRGMDVKFKLYTVPGQVRYNQTRRMVLKNVDGLVFVADSQESMMDANLESLENLRENLEALHIDPSSVPLVMQFNKRDLPAVLPLEVLESVLNPERQFRTIAASAISGEGVFATLREACKSVLRSVVREVGGEGTEVEPVATPSIAPPSPRGTVPSRIPAEQTAKLGGPPPILPPVAVSPKGAPERPRKSAVRPPSLPGSATAGRPSSAGDPTVSKEPAQSPGSRTMPAVVEATHGHGPSDRGETHVALVALTEQVEQSKASAERVSDAISNRLSQLERLLGEQTKASEGLSSRLGELVAEVNSAVGGLARRKDVHDLGQTLDGLGKKLEEAWRVTAAQGGSAAPAKGEAATVNVAGLASKNDVAKVAMSLRGLATKVEVEALAGKVAALPTKADIATFSRQERGEPGRMEGLASKDDVAGVAASLQGLVTKAEMGALAGELGGLAKKAEMGALAGKIGALATKAEVEAFAGKVGGLATKAEVEAFAGKVGGLATKAEVRALAGRVEGLATKADIAGLRVALATLLDRIEAQTVGTVGRGAEAANMNETAKARPDAIPMVAKEASKQLPDAAAMQVPKVEESTAQEEANVEPKVESRPEAEAEAEAEAEVESKAEAEPKSKVEAEAEAEARPESKVEAEAEAEAESKPEPEPAKDLLDEDPRHIAAARTVRVMLADLVLYHPKQIEEGVRENDFLERNKAALADIQETYESRVPADVRAQRDHLQAGIDTLIVKKRKELGLQ